MRVLMFSTDNKIFEEGSAVRKRMIAYGSLFEYLRLVVVSRGGFSSESIAGNIDVLHVPVNSLFSWALLFARGIPAGKYGGVDIVTSQDPFEIGLIAWRTARKIRAPIQFQIHTDFLSPHFAMSLVNRIRVRIAGFLLTRGNCIRVVSKRIADSVASKFHISSSKFTILPIYVDIEKIRNTEPVFDLHKRYPQFDFIVLVAGRQTSEKNHDLAIRAFHDIVRDHPRSGLVIVGNGQEHEALQAIVGKLQLRENVIFEDWQDDLLSYYKTADVFLLTSNYEGFGMALIEAAAAGCPIVTTDVGVVGEVFKDRLSALVCLVGDKRCLAAHLRELRAGGIGDSLALKAGEAINHLLYSEAVYLSRYKTALTQCQR